MRKTSRASTTATRRSRRWPCSWRRPMSPTGSVSSSTTARQRQADLNGKQVLEVSCGHGGGASHLVRTLRPASYTGLDFNADGIALCRKRHILPGLDFVHGNAESLPFADQSFDAVINVEASHAYPQLPRFLAEVVRVLRPGGHFLYADLRGRTEFSSWETALVDTQMRQVSARVINAEVLRGMEKNSQRSLDADRSRAAGVSAPLRPPIRRCAGHLDIPRPPERENRVPDVLLQQELSALERSGQQTLTATDPCRRASEQPTIYRLTARTHYSWSARGTRWLPHPHPHARLVRPDAWRGADG